MASTPAQRVALRIPNLLTLFFSISLVLGFSSLANHFNWRTDPSFDIRDWADVLVLLGFLTTLYFVTSVWLAYSVLLERNPYALSFGRFYFDAARFGLMFAILMWSFLAGQPAQFQHYIFGLAFWHLMMAAWYVNQMRATEGSAHAERRRDLRIHGLSCLVYFVLGVVYYYAVASTWVEGQTSWLYVGLVLLTYAVLIISTSRRLSDLRSRVMHESTVPAESSQ
jgi:hypothetical protein